MIKYSIVVPCFNSENFITTTFHSLRNFLIRNDIEIIFIDDNSTDNTKFILKRYEKQYKNVILIINETNQGPGMSRKNAVNIARGEYICFCDSDDWFEDNYFNILDEYRNFDILYFDIYYIRNNKKIYVDKTSHFKEANKDSIISNCGESLCNMVIKRKLFNTINVLDVRHGEDLALVPLLVLGAKNIQWISKPLYNYYIRKNSVSNKVDKDAYIDMRDAFMYIYDNVIDKNNQAIEYIGIKTILYNATLMALKANHNYTFIRCNLISIFELLYPKWYQNIYLCELSVFKKIYLYCIKNNHAFLLKILVFVHKCIV